MKIVLVQIIDESTTIIKQVKSHNVLNCHRLLFIQTLSHIRVKDEVSTSPTIKCLSTPAPSLPHLRKEICEHDFFLDINVPSP